MRVLVIDDDSSVGPAIRLLLARQGCDVELVTNGGDGVLAFETSPFDVVIVDIFLPDTDGLETIKRLRARGAIVPIVAMSGFRYRESMGAGLDYLGMAIESGATSCLRKPFSPQQLMAAIDAKNGLTSANHPSADDREQRQGSMQ